ncbi:hypothetical protein SELMODRAFT_425059 [Selaginella moellendorffii]|uniref:PIN domain-containing protein n=1 Tax=Selaginella moellendorffii TaxID=88036 RepID=D8SRW5_SELML|nr:hypothetical protein SELMODRAFT_425059 [Selaginella moellendorffii]
MEPPPIVASRDICVDTNLVIYFVDGDASPQLESYLRASVAAGSKLLLTNGVSEELRRLRPTFTGTSRGLTFTRYCNSAQEVADADRILPLVRQQVHYNFGGMQVTDLRIALESCMISSRAEYHGPRTLFLLTNDKKFATSFTVGGPGLVEVLADQLAGNLCPVVSFQSLGAEAFVPRRRSQKTTGTAGTGPGSGRTSGGSPRPLGGSNQHGGKGTSASAPSVASPGPSKVWKPKSNLLVELLAWHKSLWISLSSRKPLEVHYYYCDSSAFDALQRGPLRAWKKSLGKVCFFAPLSAVRTGAASGWSPYRNKYGIELSGFNDGGDELHCCIGYCS